jgi:streptogramin lyase
MLALYRSGRQAEALDTYRSGRKLLADELGLEPGDELRRLEKAILEQDPAIAAPAAPKRRRPAPEERGLHRPGPRLTIAIGALLVAAAVVGIVVAVSGNSSAPAVMANSVAVVDPKSGRVVADVPIGGRPIAIAIGAGAVWVVNADDQTIVRIDPKSRKVAKTIGGLGINVSDVAIGSGSVWVAGGNDGTLTPIDPNLNAPGEPIDLGAGQEALPQPVFEVATGAGHVWITRGNKVLRIDPRTGEIRTIAVSRPQGLEVGAGSAWVTQLNEHLLRFDANTGRKTADEDLSQQLGFPLVYAGSLWLYGYADDIPQILRVNLSTVKQEGTPIPFASTELPFALAGGAGAVWTTTHNAGDLWRVDPKTNRARKVVLVGHHPVAVAVGEGAVWVGVQQDPFN